MIPFTEIEALLILCFCKFDKAKNLPGFVARFNDYFGRDIGEQTLQYEVSIIRSAEESANMPATEKRTYYRDLWAKYSFGTRLNETKEFYQGFKNGKYSAKLTEPAYPRTPLIEITIDEPIPKPEESESRSQRQQRSAIIKLQALEAAGYKCECNCGRTLFLRKDGQHPYTEGHHLIPLRFQADFCYSLDVPANVVSLCPSCHRQLHYGIEVEQILEYLWTARRERLAKCGICLSLLDLLLMYR